MESREQTLELLERMASRGELEVDTDRLASLIQRDESVQSALASILKVADGMRERLLQSDPMQQPGEIYRAQAMVLALRLAVDIFVGRAFGEDTYQYEETV